MLTAAIPESPTARLLLELATQRANCKVLLAGRTLFLRDGLVVALQGLATDLSLGPFLVACGRVEQGELLEAEQTADARSVPLEQVLSELDTVGPEVLLDVYRALLLDRLVRVLELEEGAALQAAPEPVTASPRGPAFDTIDLVLDALARRAAFGQAEIVGARPEALFVWRDCPEQRRAESWAELAEVPSELPVSALLPRHPSAPCRIVALVRAGVARLDGGEVDALAEPATRSEPPRAATMTVERRDSSDELSSLGPLGIEPVESWLPAHDTALEDPLAPLEERIHALSQASAPAREQASAWLDLAEAWLRHQRAHFEAARAAREAVAVAPDDLEALSLAAALTAATGAPEAAYAYAIAWAEHAGTPDESRRALRAAAEYASRAGRLAEHCEALRRAVAASPGDPLLEEPFAHALAAQGDVQAAVEHARKAAERLRAPAPERARALLSWAAGLAPANLRTWTDLAKTYVRAGRGEVGVAILARAARIQSDPALRERLRLAGVAFAELAKGPDVASELLLEAVELRPALAEPLCANLAAAGAWVELAVLASELAGRAAGTERAQLLLQAAEARVQLPDGDLGACELLSEALCADPDLSPAYDTLAQLCTKLERPQVLIDALERALRLRTQDRKLLTGNEQLRSQVVHLAERLERLLTGVTGAPLRSFVAALTYELEGKTLELAAARELEQQIELFEREFKTLERALRTAPAHERASPALQLAAWCRHDPSRRTTARKLYDKVLEREPARVEALSGLSSLLWLEGDEEARAHVLGQRARTEPSARVHLEHALALRRAGQPARALGAALEAMQSPEREPEVLVLAWRLSLANGDPLHAAAALSALADATPEPRRRAQLLMRLARAQHAAGERALAADSAQRALLCDPGSAEAAFAVLDSAEPIASAGGVALLEAVRAVIGDTPELLRQLGRACFATSDAQGQRRALETLSELWPEDHYAARALVAIHTTGRDPEELEQALKRALHPARFSRRTAHIAQQGLTRLAQLTTVARAIELVLATSELLGEQARPLVAWAASVASELGSDPLYGAVLEARVTLARGEAQAAELRRLAEFRRGRGALWAEVRTALRLLAIAPDDAPALQTLVDAYARAGEGERLEAVLELLAERAETDTSKREHLLTLALCRLQFGNDLNGAAALVEQALSLPTEPSLEVLRRAIGLLRRAGPEQAFGLLLRQADRSSSDRARDLFEEALLLAEHGLGKPALALQAATQGALRHPAHEPFVRALERTARASGQLALAVTTLEAVSERCETPERQAELLLRAASGASDLQDTSRECTLLDRAYRATPTQAIEELVIACAGRLFTQDMRAGRLAYDQLRDTLHVRAKFGSALARGRALMTLARLAHDVYLSRDDAARYAEAARTLLADAGADAPPDELDRARTDVATLLLRFARQNESLRPAPRASQAPRRSVAHEVDPSYAAALHNAPTLRPVTGSLEPLAPASPSARILPTIEPTLPRAELASFDLRPRVELSERPGEPERLPGERAGSDGLLAQVLERGPAPSEPDVASVVAGVASGDTAALPALHALLERLPGCASDVCTELLLRVREGELHVCALRGLRMAGGRAREHVVWRTASQALALVEPELRPPTQLRRRDARGPLADAALAAARQTPHAAEFALLGQLAEAAAPLFRRNLVTAGAESGDLRPLRDPPYSHVLSELAATFGTRHDAYLTPTEQNHVGLVSVLPATILVGNRTPPDAQSLRFRFARAFEHARNENVLLATLSTARAEALLVALIAAFGPPEIQRAQVSRDAASLASELWRTMPSAAQRAITRALKDRQTTAQTLDQRSLEAAVRLRSARAGLYVTRELDVALAQLGLDGDAYEARVGASEGELNRALREQPLVSGLVAYAFSEAYLRWAAEPDASVQREL